MASLINTFFLPSARWPEYGQWLSRLDQETLSNYFGVITKQPTIDSLIQKMLVSKDCHHVLVATKNNSWIGTTHIATSRENVEFGLIVSPQYRQRGIASLMLDESIVWARNRGFVYLFMHCINQNIAIQGLCRKYQLIPRNVMGDLEVKFQLASPNTQSLLKEFLLKQIKLIQLTTIFWPAQHDSNVRPTP